LIHLVLNRYKGGLSLLENNKDLLCLKMKSWREWRLS